MQYKFLSLLISMSISSTVWAINLEQTKEQTELAQQCAALKEINLPNTTINKTEWNQVGNISADRMAALTGGKGKEIIVKPHCIIEGEIGARTGADGKHYGTLFQLRLPENWNQKFLFQGGGGVDGFVAPALGSIPIRSSTAAPALLRGYAVVTMDGGHPTPTPDFGADQQARLDFAYQSIGKVTPVAKQLIAQFYQQTPKHSYFMGCSNGGREAMIAAQRYPLDFDGIIAANAGFRLSRAAVAEVWDTKHFMSVAPQNEQGQKILANAFSQQELDSVVQGVLAHCDHKDGLADGVINAWEKCDFDPATLSLPPEKINALKAIFAGTKDSQGNEIYSGWFYDTGIAEKGWRDWKLGDSQTVQPNARNVTLGFGALAAYFMTPYNPQFDVMKFDFDKDTAKTYQTGAINDAISTDLSSFKANGGKMIIVTGISDPVFSALDQRNWFNQLQADTQGTDQFARLFMIPGLTHCGGGKAFNNVDPLTALENWHDKEQAPNQLLATGEHFPQREMPICAYPKIATYMGGDESKASSFECK